VPWIENGINVGGKNKVPMTWVGDLTTAGCYLRRFYGGFLEFKVNKDINLFVNSAHNLRALRKFIYHRLRFIEMKNVSIEEKLRIFTSEYFGRRLADEINKFEYDIRTYSADYLKNILFSIDDLYCIDDDADIADIIINELEKHPEVNQLRLYNKIITKNRPLYGYIKKPSVSLNEIVGNERVINEFLNRRFGIDGVIYPRAIMATLGQFYHECIAIMPEYLTVQPDSDHSWMNWGFNPPPTPGFELNRGYSSNGDNKFRYMDKYTRGRKYIDNLSTKSMPKFGSSSIKIFSLKK
jgi:hypothetical protein